MAAINRIVEGSLFHQLDAQFISSKESPRKCKIVVESGYYQSANEWLQGNTSGRVEYYTNRIKLRYSNGIFQITPWKTITG